jgi:hypothetical protein
MPSLEVRDAAESDIDGIARLSFAEDPAAARDAETFARMWKWLHQENPTPGGQVIVGADESSGEIVGHYSMLPFRFRRHGQPFATGGFACRLLVAESHRNQFLFPKLELKLLGDYPKRGIDFAYGLLNRPLVLKAHLFFKFKAVCVLPVMARPMKLGKALDRAVKNPTLRKLARPFEPIGDALLPHLRWPDDDSIEIRAVDRFHAGLDEKLAPLIEKLPLAAERTSQMLNWRFATFADRGYRIALATTGDRLRGYVVTRAMPMKELTALAVVDILFDPADTAAGNALVNTALDQVRHANADVCAAIVNPHGPYLALLKRHGFIRTPESFTVIVHDPNDQPLNLTAIPPADWHFTWFDHDFV